MEKKSVSNCAKKKPTKTKTPKSFKRILHIKKKKNKQVEKEKKKGVKETEPVRNCSFCENSSLGLTVGFLFVPETLFFKAVKVASRQFAVQS